MHLCMVTWGDSDPVRGVGGVWEGAIMGALIWADVHKGYIVLIKS